MSDSRTEGVEWQYTLSRPGRDWAQSDFNATAWKKSKGGFGQNGTPGAVVRTDWRTSDIWLRKTFEAAEKPAGLALLLHHDDDVEVYLNGKPIYRAKGYLVNYQRIPLGPQAQTALRRGTNVLAIHCKQIGGGQYIDAGLVTDSQADLDSLLKQHGETLVGAAALNRYREVKAELGDEPQDGGAHAGDGRDVRHRGRPIDDVLLVRGNPHSPGEEVTAGFPVVLGDMPAKPGVPGKKETSGQPAPLAEWLTH